MSKDKQPEIRFPGFTEDWEQCLLGETLKDLKSGLSRMLSNDDIGLPVVRANNINDGQFDMINDVKYWYENDPQGAKTENYLVHKNDILINFINSEAKMGTATIVQDEPERKTIYTTNILKAQVADNFDADFWFALTQTYRYKIDIKMITKPAVNQASFTTVDFKKLSYPFPAYDEQVKIGSFFKNLDHLITLHQRKLDLLKETKKGFLQKMFPKNGAKVPEIRFPGFTEDWEQRKFKEFSKKTGKKNTKDLDFPAYSVSNKAGLISQTEQFDGSRLDDLEKTNYKFVEPNEFAYNPARVNVGSIAFNNLGMTVIVSSLYVVVKMSEDLDNEFILQFIKSPTFIKEVKRNTEGSVREYLFYENFANIKFPFTRNKEEQQKIGAFFKQLDDTIALHQRKLDLLKETKKGFLQKMFV
ncbi:restriction endonuclease (plasmid) [Enterococcus faecium]|nr:restriction endonuclease [Enterococcus faecium]HEA4078102.1 restriction endonuclease subunit S [Enterococcus faecium]